VTNNTSDQPSRRNATAKPRTGGGLHKIMHTLNLARQAGWQPTTKALTAKNACKACGLGMGGQQGGMTNELGEFPAVCNKSVQAQSSDLSPPIPHEIFDHSITSLMELDDFDLNQLGRLNTPLIKYANEDRFYPADWEEAINLAIRQLRATPAQRSFFYSSGRSSNEAGFVLQLFARLFGTNNVNNCSYYCHQATTEGLASSIGTGTATIELTDLAHSDCIFLFGANPASNHPRFIYQLEACRARGGEVIVINPAKESGLVRFAMPKSAKSLIAGGSQIASEYLQPHIGSDIDLMQGIAKAVLELGGADTSFICAHSRGFANFKRQLENRTWPSIVKACGVNEASIRRVAGKYCVSNNAVFAWGMGLTHHLHGVDNIEEVANLAMLRGMVGKPHAGLLPLRGHSNVQGIGTIGVKPILAEEVMANIEAHLNVSLPTEAGLDTMAAMQAAHARQIDTALMMGGNLYASNPNSRWAAQAFARIPFKIYLTTTLNSGHLQGLEGNEALILPVTARDEEWQPTTQESMFSYVRLSDGGITRLSHVRPESHILCDIAAGVLADHPQRFDFTQFREHRTVRETIAATIPGLEALADIDEAKREFHIRGRKLSAPSFATQDGKCHFRCHSSATVDHSELPFRLASVRSEGQFNSIVYERSDSYRGIPHRWCILMNRKDMRDLKLSPDDLATVRSLHGVMQDVHVFPFDLPRGNVLAYFPEANALIGTEVDARSKTPAFKSTRIAIVRQDRKRPKPMAAKKKS